MNDILSNRAHNNLVFSSKHTKGDFLRTFPFNPTLGIGKHQQIVEVQCQREYEGRGAHPNYVAGSVLNGFEEYDGDNPPRSLIDLKDNPNFKGVWTWSRAGGWKGPYISNELWPDVNAYVSATWAHDTSRSDTLILQDYAQRMKLSEDDVSHFVELANLSQRGVLLGRSSKITQINPWWIRVGFMRGIRP